MQIPSTPLSRAEDLVRSTGAPAYIYAEDLPETYVVADAVYHHTRLIVSSDASLRFRRVTTVLPRTARVED